MSLRHTPRPILVAAVAFCALLASCSSATELADFEVTPLEAAEPTAPPAATAEAVPDAAATGRPDPAELTEEPATTPATSTAPEPNVAAETTPAATPDPAPEPTATSAPAIEPDPVLVVDSSRRGQVIPVTLESGQTVDRVDGELLPGQTIVYSFDVAEGQSVLVRQLGNCVFFNDNVLLVDLDGPRGFGGSLFFNISSSDCTDSKRYTSEATGTATLTFADINPEFTGTYSFEVVDVTNEPVVELALGDRIEPNSPVDGAGVLEFPGSEDVYTFDVQPGDAFLARQLSCDLANTPIVSIEFDGAVRGGFSMQPGAGCDDVRRYDVTAGGSVTVTVDGGADNEGTGTYSFELVDLNADNTIALQYGDVVALDSPAQGAGNIEVPGARDTYTLEMVKDETVVVRQLGCDFEGDNFLSMEIQGAGVDTSMGFNDSGEDGCLDVRRLTAEFDGPVTMTLSDVDNLLTGKYSFEVGAGAETVEEAEEVLEEIDASEVDGERLITLDETVLFEFGSADLKANADQALADVADVLGVYTEGQVRIVGHTDSIGSDADNQRLSQRRAEAVVDALVDLGVDSDRMTATGQGEAAPIEPNENDDGSDNPDGRSANRRVEIFFTTEAP